MASSAPIPTTRPLEELSALSPELLAHARVDDDVGGRVQRDEEGHHRFGALQPEGIGQGVPHQGQAVQEPLAVE